MLALTEKQALIQALGQVVFDEVKAAITPLTDRVMRLEKALGDLAVSQDIPLGEARSGENPPPPVDVDFLRQYVAGALEVYEQTHPVQDGKDGAPGKDGRDGADGADGTSVCLDDIRRCVADLVAEAVGGLALPRSCVAGVVDRAGHLCLSFSDGSLVDLGEVVGRDGKDCDMQMVGQKIAELVATIDKPKDGKDGIDGLGIEQIEYDGERTFRLANEKIDRSFVLPFPIYRGLWMSGHRYQRGDTVSSDGCTYTAMEETDKEPGTIASGWRLSVKQGRKGRDGKDGKDAK